MTRNQRLTFLGIAVAIAAIAVIVFVAGGGGDDGETGAAATPTSTPTATATESPDTTPTPTSTPTSTPTPTATPDVPVLRAGRVRELEYTEGDDVRFTVENDAPEEVHVHGYDLTEEVGPNKPADFSFPANITGIFEVELEGAGEPIAELKVQPR